MRIRFVAPKMFHRCDSQSVHLCAVEGVSRHRLDAVPGQPSVATNARPKKNK